MSQFIEISDSRFGNKFMINTVFITSVTVSADNPSRATLFLCEEAQRIFGTKYFEVLESYNSVVEQLR